MVFDDKISKVTFIREGIIPPNWKDLVQRISKSGALKNIDLKDTWFNPDLQKDTRKTPSNEPKVAPDNIRNMLTLLQSVLHAQKSTANEEESVSEVIEHSASEVFRNT